MLTTQLSVAGKATQQVSRRIFGATRQARTVEDSQITDYPSFRHPPRSSIVDFLTKRPG
jgi:hypothetical protein